jgi:hypothetical protein
MYGVLTGVFHTALDPYNIDASMGNKMLQVMWVGVAFSIASGLFWTLSVCCCSGKSPHKKIVAEKTGHGYERVGSRRSRGKGISRVGRRMSRIAGRFRRERKGLSMIGRGRGKGDAFHDFFCMTATTALCDFLHIPWRLGSACRLADTLEIGYEDEEKIVQGIL